jgi:branched-chain amino acid transport system substrate-binding protein
MRHTSRTARLFAVAAAGTLVLTACGDDSGGGSGDGGSSEPAAASACDSFTSAPPAEEGTAITPPAGVSKSDGVLTIGSLLPQTGNLAFLGPPEFAGVDLAIKDINEAGGVLGKPVKYIEGDSGDAQQDVANPTVDRLLRGGADAIIGAASSGVTFNVIDKITSAGVVSYSPANTSPDFTTYADKGLYFRTAPSDVLQGRVLGETLVADGRENVAILALQDPYGEGLAQNVGLAVCNGGSNVPVETVFYDPAASNFDAQIGEIKAAEPDAVVLVGFEESAKVIQAMVAQQVGPQDVPLYLVDGNLGNALGEDLPAGLLEGTKGSLPGAEATEEFRARLQEVDPELTDYSYSGESYDAVITTALAAEVAKSDGGDKIATVLADVTRGGEKCTDFASCKELISGGTTDIDYDGVSGPIEFSDVGDPTQATIGIYSYGADNKLVSEVDYVEGNLNEG